MIGTLCVACATQGPSTYVPFDPAFKKQISQAGTIPVLLYPDDPIEAVYNQSPALDNVPYQGGGLTDVVVTVAANAGINAINSSVADERKRAAYQTALPVIEQLSALDLKSDIAHSLAAEMKRVQWLKLGAPVAISQKTIFDKETQNLKAFDTYPSFLASLMPPGRPERFYLTFSFKQRVQDNYVLQLRYQLFSKDDGVLIFRNDAIFVCPGGASNRDWPSWWAENHGQRLQAAYTRGVHALAALVAYDLGARTELDDKIGVARSDAGLLTARCPGEWWN